MPILARETDVFPADLFHDRPYDANLSWWALYTLSRQEKELTRRLLVHGVAFYAPTIARTTRSPGGRIRTSHVPLFSNYVFIHGDDDARYAALTTRCVSRWFEITRPAQLVDDLRRIKTLLDLGLDVSPEAQLMPGQRVRVKSGPLTGHVGTLLDRRGSSRLLIAVDFLQQGASVEIQGFDIEAV